MQRYTFYFSPQNGLFPTVTKPTRKFPSVPNKRLGTFLKQLQPFPLFGRKAFKSRPIVRIRNIPPSCAEEPCQRFCLEHIPPVSKRQIAYDTIHSGGQRIIIQQIVTKRTIICRHTDDTRLSAVGGKDSQFRARTKVSNLILDCGIAQENFHHVHQVIITSVAGHYGPSAPFPGARHRRLH